MAPSVRITRKKEEERQVIERTIIQFLDVDTPSDLKLIKSLFEAHLYDVDQPFEPRSKGLLYSRVWSKPLNLELTSNLESQLVACTVQVLKGHVYDASILIRSYGKKTDEYRIVRPISQAPPFMWGWPLSQLGRCTRCVFSAVRVLDEYLMASGVSGGEDRKSDLAELLEVIQRVSNSLEGARRNMASPNDEDTSFAFLCMNTLIRPKPQGDMVFNFHINMTALKLSTTITMPGSKSMFTYTTSSEIPWLREVFRRFEQINYLLDDIRQKVTILRTASSKS